MLSYQHAYHAGNAADVHKHAALAWMLAYLTQKPKPLSYIETHAGRGLYDLDGAEARKTGEAAAGIGALLDRFDPDHPYRRVIAEVRARHGPGAYPGSPMIAQQVLRDTDRLHFAELHPREHAALRQALATGNARIYRQDGFTLAQSLAPPEPRRGLMLVDPSWEVKDDYAALPRFTAQVARKWPVGILAVWYPLLADARHRPMLRKLQAQHHRALRHEVRFAAARTGHGMTGSGLFVVNPPWGLEDHLEGLSKALFS